MSLMSRKIKTRMKATAAPEKEKKPFSFASVRKLREVHFILLCFYDHLRLYVYVYMFMIFMQYLKWSIVIILH